MTGITDRWLDLRARIDRAAAAAGRQGQDVTLVAVSKGQSLEAVHSAHSAGARDFGENYLQEVLPKIEGSGPELIWHFIGAIQSNKTRPIAERFAWVQTVAAPKIAERLSAQRPFYGPALQVCLQVRPAGAGHRAGCPEADIPALAAVVAGLPRLSLRGLMIIPNATQSVAALRAEFRRVAMLAAGLRGAGHAVDTLSMGMSDDFEHAIAEGSTMVRIGTALFGARRSA